MIRDKNTEIILAVSEESDQTEKFAAEELAKYLSRMVDNKRIIITTRRETQKAIYVGILPANLDNLLLRVFQMSWRD